jgi:hypothetical protein
MALTAPGPPPVAQMLPDVKKRKNRRGSTCSACGARGHTARSLSCPNFTEAFSFDFIMRGFPSVRLQDLNWDAFYFAPLTSTLSVCPELMGIVESVTPR